jgi:dihydrofolate synthase/folylpolyglutamate synthase
MTAQAFHHFAKVGAGWQVIEVGLGGRLDSTNIITPEVSVITNISLDHVATLGDTIAKIAFEKAGIIKAGVPIVVAPQTSEAMTVVRQVAKERGAPLVDVAAIMTWQPESADHGGQSFRLTGANGEYSLRTPLLGDYQIENAATAVAAIETLNHNGAGISKKAIAQGIREVRWPARLQVLSTSGPLIVVDGAHNPYSVRRLVDTLPSLFEYDDVVLVFGALSGHSASGMLAELVRLSPRLIAVKSRHPRSADSATVADAARRFGIDVTFATNDVAEGTRHALKLVGPKTLLLAAGSLSVAAEVTEEIESIPAEVYPNLKPPPDIAKNPSV